MCTSIFCKHGKEMGKNKRKMKYSNHRDSFLSLDKTINQVLIQE